MASTETLDPIDRFAELIEARFGLRFDETRRDLLAEVLERRAGARFDDVAAWLARFERGASTDELRVLAEELTVGESYFFRNIEQLRAFAEVAVPARAAARARAKTLRVLSAGCAGGEEPYSLAMALREGFAADDWRIEITGLDMNVASLRRAAAGRYTQWAMRELPADLQRRWFHTHGREYELAPEVKAMVRFVEHNLSEESATIWEPERYDVVFCRNVLMYFAPHHAHAIVGRIERALAPGGFLFLGHAESLRGLSHAFELRQSHGTFYYERKGGDPARPLAPATTVSRSIVALVDHTDSWIDTIRDAAERIRDLTAERIPDAPQPRVQDNAARVAAALELLRVERYGEALDLLDGIAPVAACDVDVMLLRAVLLTHAGRIASAEQACNSLLALDGLNAGAHYLLALCAERSGALANAAEHDEAAAYLDPSFAMARLHLGLMARRRREQHTARRELARALALLEREDPARLLLFGGGFGRETLVALCSAELAACGGAP